MKRFVILLAAAVLFALPSFAGEPEDEKGYYPHSVYCGYGNVPLFAYSNRDDVNNQSGVLNLGYEYRPLKMLGLGVDLGWMHNVGQHCSQTNYAGGVSLPNIVPFRNDTIFLSANLRGLWVNLDHFSCYSGIRGGVAFRVEGSACSMYPNLQLIPVGLEAGIRRIGAYAELGLGTNSTFSFGARLHF